MVLLSDHELERLLRRCARIRSLRNGLSAFEAWSRWLWPGSLLVLTGLCALRVLRQPLWPAAVAWLVWLPVSAWRCRRTMASTALADWVLPAWVDRHSGARGALMARHAGVGTRPVPAVAAQLRLPVAWPRKCLATWSLLGAGAAAALLWPLPPAVAVHPPTVVLTPMPVQRASELLERVHKLVPDQQAFVETAHKSLKAMTARGGGGLSRADFDALQRIESRARGLLRKRAEALHGQREALAAVDEMLARAGDDAAQRAGDGALSPDRGRMLEQLMRGGLQRQQAEEMLRRAAEQGASQGQSGQEQGQGQGKPGGRGFDRGSVEALRKQIGEKREVLAQQAAEAEAEGEGPGGQPALGGGTAPLRYDHLTLQAENAELQAQGFAARADDRTVMLSSGLSKRAEGAQLDPQAVSGARFGAGSQTRYLHKRIRPRDRAVLQRYFGGADD